MISSTKVKRAVIVVSLVLGTISFACLTLYFLALTDIWSESGSPDFWRGQGLCFFEWRILGVCYWPMFLFHLAFFVVAILALRSLAGAPVDENQPARSPTRLPMPEKRKLRLENNEPHGQKNPPILHIGKHESRDIQSLHYAYQAVISSLDRSKPLCIL